MKEKIRIRVLVLPKFELGAMTGDEPGEAQHYYEAYLRGAQEFEVPGTLRGHPLYVKDGVALHVVGIGKVNTGVSLTALLLDPRFDFSECVLLGTGIAGGASETTVIGDVVLASAAADFDLGHTADPRELQDASADTWFHDSLYDEFAVYKMNETLVNAAYAAASAAELRTTDKTQAFMKKAFPDSVWAARPPRLLKGTILSGDNYWKGIHGERNARRIAETYGCPDPYAATEMEDVAISHVAARFGMLDRVLIIRGICNLDLFMNGARPENLWGGGNAGYDLLEGETLESAESLTLPLENTFRVGEKIIEMLLHRG